MSPDRAIWQDLVHEHGFTAGYATVPTGAQRTHRQKVPIAIGCAPVAALAGSL